MSKNLESSFLNLDSLGLFFNAASREKMFARYLVHLYWAVMELRSTQIQAILIRSLQTLLLITYQAKLLIHCRSVLEEEDERGVAYMVEHLAFRATAKYPILALLNFFRVSGLHLVPVKMPKLLLMILYTSFVFPSTSLDIYLRLFQS